MVIGVRCRICMYVSCGVHEVVNSALGLIFEFLFRLLASII
jgi:hypothetical protein